ncbi:MAG: hypothetical protein J6Y86_06655 [Pseudobutyrivibrio sp.]|nr:hypothetical protein [Pseudobutyrivibrio sp.]
MNSKTIIFGILCFVGGAAAGAAGMWKYSQKRANAAIEESRKMYSEKEHVVKVIHSSINDENKELAKKAINKPDISEYRELVGGYNAPVPVKPEKEVKKVTYISDIEFAESDNETVELVLDTDTEVLKKRNEEGDFDVVNNPEDHLGVNWEDHFDEYEDDTCYVRNDSEGIDYIIVKTMPTIDSDDD